MRFCPFSYKIKGDRHIKCGISSGNCIAEDDKYLCKRYKDYENKRHMKN